MIGWGMSWVPVAIGYRDQLLEMMTHIWSGRLLRQKDITSGGGQEIKSIKVILLTRTKNCVCWLRKLPPFSTVLYQQGFEIHSCVYQLLILFIIAHECRPNVLWRCVKMCCGRTRLVFNFLQYYFPASSLRWKLKMRNSEWCSRSLLCWFNNALVIIAVKAGFYLFYSIIFNAKHYWQFNIQAV